MLAMKFCLYIIEKNSIYPNAEGVFVVIETE